MLDPVDGTPEPRDSFIADIDGDFIDELVINFKSDDHYHIRQLNAEHTGWESLPMLDLDPTGIPTPRWARAAMFQAGTDPAVAQSDFDHDGLGIATERGDVIGAWACFHIPDIFVEVDWMPGHEMSDEAGARVAWAFARHGIALHIDRGEMGGGGETIPHDDECNENESANIYTNYFLHGNSNNPRIMLFHYGFYGHYNAESHDFLGTTFGRDRFAVWEQANGDYAFWHLSLRWQTSACTFMHELGHTLGLDRDYLGFSIPISEYPSSMNYNSVDLVDYSDGTHGSYDFNDWGEMNLTYFNTEGR